MTYSDILKGEGENYILLSKEPDGYKILYTGGRMLDIQKQLTDLFTEVKEEYDNRKSSNKTLVS